MNHSCAEAIFRFSLSKDLCVVRSLCRRVVQINLSEKFRALLWLRLLNEWLYQYFLNNLRLDFNDFIYVQFYLIVLFFFLFDTDMRVGI